MADPLTTDGVTIRFDYCGRCGKNLPPEDAETRVRIIQLVKQAEPTE